MAKKEINIFNVSFLDLLSGALGAVLILFVIVPKLDSKIRQQLQELETFQSLKLEVNQIEGMIGKLSSSVPKEQLNELKSQFNSISTQIDVLEKEIKQLQVQLGKCDDEKAKLLARVQSKDDEIKSLKAQLGKNGNLTEELQKENAKLRSQVTTSSEQVAQVQQEVARLNTVRSDLDASKAQLEQQIQELNKEIQSKNDALAKTDKREQALKNTIAELKEAVEAAKKGSSAEMADALSRIETLKKENKELEKQANQSKNSGTNIDKTGLEFKDKNIIFVIDVSGSMDDAPEPEKLDQVKAGLKMLVATMNEDYKIDVVIFPKSPTEDYDALFGKMRTVTNDVKYQVYGYVSRLYARNCTPTRSVMDYVFNEPSYKKAGTITFLSDGLPTRASGTDCLDEDYMDVVRQITKLNGGAKTINTLGVGSAYRNNVVSDPKVMFMRKLAAKNGGFFIGF